MRSACHFFGRSPFDVPLLGKTNPETSISSHKEDRPLDQSQLSVRRIYFSKLSLGYHCHSLRADFTSLAFEAGEKSNTLTAQRVRFEAKVKVFDNE